MKKKFLAWFLRGFVILINLLAAAVLAACLAACINAGYEEDVWKDVLEKKPYIETEEYQQAASKAVYDALAVMARSTRMEQNGVYDPDRIIRVNDYLESGTVYDTVPESEKKNGICYRMGDLYQWSVKGAGIHNNVLIELYDPLFYGSVQAYALDNDEEEDESYNQLVNHILEAMEQLKNDVANYQEDKKTWNLDASNVHFALRSLSGQNIYTNVPELQDSAKTQEEFETYFQKFESYYIFDSRSSNAAAVNMGDAHSYNTWDLLNEWQMQLTEEYQVYVGIDTSFPASDSLAAGALAYEEAGEKLSQLSSYIGPAILSGVILLITAVWIAVRLCMLLWKAIGIMLGNAGAVFRICSCFAAYELIQVLFRSLFKETAALEIVLLIFKLAVLALLIWEGIQRQKLLEGVRDLTAGNGETSIPTKNLFRSTRQLAEAINDLGKGFHNALQEQMKSERMKTDLITNVSHDLKTPLTSIINYVDLMKRERIENPKAQEYLTILDQKSQRLKQLTEDLVEASRASSGNVTLNMEKIDLREILMQTSGEFEERFSARGLILVAAYPKHPLYVMADGRRLWRIIENLYRNVEKYAMPHTRVYLNVESDGRIASLSMKNISEQPLNISAEELMERFVRGDESRSTEGSGLGLSIARDLTELQNGTFNIYLDGDLFKVTVTFPCVQEELI